MDILGPGIAAVYDTDDLEEALSFDDDIYYVYLAADIQLERGVTIFSGKEEVTVDGFYPLDGTGVIHTLTDIDSILQAETIVVSSDSDINITFKNMIISGHNYFGIPSIHEGEGFKDVTVTYDNITYTGPQLVYNPSGLTRFKDSNITVSYPNNLLRENEVAEVCRVEMEGNVNISHNNTTLSAFWFRGDTGESYFRVLPGANVTITTLSYFMYAAVIVVLVPVARPVAYEIQEGASFTLNTVHGISLDLIHRADSFFVGENASFRFTQSASAMLQPTSFYIDGAFTVSQGASVYMQADYTASSSLIHFYTASGRLDVNNPKSFVLYRNGGGGTITFANQIPFSFQGGQLNYWTAATALEDAGTFLDIPPKKWHKENYNMFTWNGTVSSSGTTGTADFTLEEIAEFDLPPVTDLQLNNAMVLSIGNPTFSINPVVDDQTPVNGLADPAANIKVEYTVESISRSITGIAGADGKYSVLTPEAIPLTTPVTVSVNIPFLIMEKTVETEEAGELILINAPGTITFMIAPVSTQPLLLGRGSPDITVEVYDSRVYSTSWQLTASISGPLETASGHTLQDAVVYVSGANMTPLGTQPTSVYSGTENEGEPKTTECEWLETEGILLRVSEPIFNSEQYFADLSWEVQSS